MLRCANSVAHASQYKLVFIIEYFVRDTTEKKKKMWINIARKKFRGVALRDVFQF